MRSVRPVAFSAADATNTAATMIAGSLANPESASAGLRMPVIARARSVSIAARSIRTRSLFIRMPARDRRYRPEVPSPGSSSRAKPCEVRAAKPLNSNSGPRYSTFTPVSVRW